MDKEISHQAHFQIGTSATGGVVKVYFDDFSDEEDCVKKINQAIMYWKHSRVKSGKG